MLIEHWIFYMKKHISLISLGFLAILMLSGCWRQEIVDFRITVSPLRSDVCAELILNRLDSIQGVEKSSANPDEGWIEVRYDSTKIAKKNLEILISKLGFDANGLPADQASQANLPEACR